MSTPHIKRFEEHLDNVQDGLNTDDHRTFDVARTAMLNDLAEHVERLEREQSLLDERVAKHLHHFDITPDNVSGLTSKPRYLLTDTAPVAEHPFMCPRCTEKRPHYHEAHPDRDTETVFTDTAPPVDTNKEDK